jgi:hypothetical protein
VLLVDFSESCSPWWRPSSSQYSPNGISGVHDQPLKNEPRPYRSQKPLWSTGRAVLILEAAMADRKTRRHHDQHGRVAAVYL